MAEKEIGTTLKYLQQQTVYKKGIAEILIVEYDKGGTGETFEAAKPFISPLTRMMYVQRPGIAYARHQGIMASFGQVITCFDGDGYFTSHRAVEKLTEPILKGEVHLCGCDHLFNTKGLKPEQIQAIAIPQAVSDTLNQMQRNPMLPITLEPGMSFSKHAYIAVGGFPNTPMYEGAVLGTRIITKFGFQSKRHIPRIAAVVSARRALGSVADGLLTAYGNYQKAYR
jgi:hypothetical protein